jgi:hypothetical protein
MLGLNQFASSLGVMLNKLLGRLGEPLALLDDGLTLLGHAFVLLGLRLCSLTGEIGQAFVLARATAHHGQRQDDQSRAAG